MASRASIAPTLPSALLGLVLIWSLAVVSATVALVIDRTRAFQAEALREAVLVRGRHAAHDLASALDDLWQTLGAIKSSSVLGNPEGLRGALTAIVGNGDRVSWAGLAGSDGFVRVASNDLLVGVDVSARPWFQRGLAGDFAGDVHEAVLLNRLLGGTEEDPFRFIDLAARVTGEDDSVDGVLAFHIDFAWAEAYLAETADSLGIDLFLLNQAGELIVATAPIGEGVERLQAFRAAGAGVEAMTFEVWPDGQRYLATVVPSVRVGDLPSFGWRMVARIAPATFETADDDLVSSVLTVMLSTAGLLVLLTIAFSRWFLRPVGQLAENARRLADGQDEYPLESRRTSELATLSAALARLQSRRDGSDEDRR